MPEGFHNRHEGSTLTAIRRVVRILALTALLAGAGIALGFLAALVRPRPRSRYASQGQQPIASDDATITTEGA
jgi:hypothetical protein